MIRRAAIVLVPAIATVALAACDTGAVKTAHSSTANAKGVLTITAGACTGAEPSGSWFRMVQPDGSSEAGPFVSNPDSTCTEKDVTLLASAAGSGLDIGSYQPAVIAPTKFFAVAFDVSTNAKDPQTSKATAAPAVTISGSTITAQLPAWSVAWNGQNFNQGAPKPDGTGQPATGTYDPNTHRYTLQWTSGVHGGPFNGFTGVWHLDGTYQETS